MTKIEWLELAKKNIEDVNIKKAISIINEVIELIKIDEQPIQTSGYMTENPNMKKYSSDPNNWTPDDILKREG